MSSFCDELKQMTDAEFDKWLKDVSPDDLKKAQKCIDLSKARKAQIERVLMQKSLGNTAKPPKPS
jgi:hypothetical protein